MPPAKPQRRTEAQWDSLSPAQRRRYVGAGRTGTLNGRKNLTEAQVKRYYLSGKSLTAARRGRSSKEVTQQAARKTGAKPLPRSVLVDATQGELTTADDQLIRDWRQSALFPKWLPKDRELMGDDVAAILAQLNVDPARWESSTFILNPDGTVTMRVQRRGANQFGKPKPLEVTLPDFDAAVEVRDWLRKREGKGPVIEWDSDKVGSDFFSRGKVAA